MTDLEPVPPAETSYKDWVGTAAAENSMLAASGDLNELAGLDGGRWTILAVDVTGWSHGKPPQWDVAVYAVDRVANSIEGHEDIRRLAADRGSVPVTRVDVLNASLDDIVKCMKLVTFQLINPNFPDLDIVGRATYPPQD